jgi:hypothetical protein
LYFPKLAYKLLQAPVDPLSDLIDSFNFFDREARERSAFNLRSIKVEAIHYLHDWNLSLSYEGRPYLVEIQPAVPYDPGPPPISAIPAKYEYQWKSTFSVILQWQPIPEFRANVRRSWDDEEDEYVNSMRG